MRGHLRSLTAGLVLAAAGIGCERGPAPPSAASSAPASSRVAPPAPTTKRAALHGPRGPFVSFARDAAQSGLVAADVLEAELGAGRDARSDYLALRRAIAAGAPYWRRTAATFVEPLLGPPRGADEAGGSLLALDRALALGAHDDALAQLANVRKALAVIDDGLGEKDIGRQLAVDMMAGAAFDVGLVALEAVPGVPDGHDAALADLLGVLDVLAHGIDALEATSSAAAQSKLEPARLAVTWLRERTTAAKSTLDLQDRASFVGRTGHIGDAVRAFAEVIGVKVPRPSYDVRKGSRLTALTVPLALREPPFVKQGLSGEARDLGFELFRDRRLSKGSARACATCHDPARAFTDGLARPVSLDPAAPPLRNTPTLLYMPLMAVQMWDGRTLTPEAQALNVIHSKTEMGLTDHELVAALRARYDEPFAAFPGGLTPQNVASALVAFEYASLVPGTAPIDRFAAGDDSALSPDQRAGLDVFAGKGRCARCHVPPSFGGSRPPDFSTPVFSVLGVPVSPAKLVLDDDRGRGAVTKRPSDEHAFKTPTVRNVARTGPYFHHGAYGRLEAVVDFYDKGGGRGFGIDVQNQDPDVRPLKLTLEENRVLLVFLKTGLLDQ